MRTTNCPECGGYITGDLPALYDLPLHIFDRPDMELLLASENDPGLCPASGHLVPTVQTSSQEADEKLYHARRNQPRATSEQAREQRERLKRQAEKK